MYVFVNKSTCYNHVVKAYALNSRYFHLGGDKQTSEVNKRVSKKSVRRDRSCFGMEEHVATDSRYQKESSNCWVSCPRVLMR